MFKFSENHTIFLWSFFAVIQNLQKLPLRFDFYFCNLFEISVRLGVFFVKLDAASFFGRLVWCVRLHTSVSERKSPTESLKLYYLIYRHFLPLKSRFLEFNSHAFGRDPWQSSKMSHLYKWRRRKNFWKFYYHIISILVHFYTNFGLCSLLK